VTPPYPPGGDGLLSALRDFEAAYEAYGEFQRTIERYWSLRWIEQEQKQTLTGVVIRENLVRLDDLPIVHRVASLPLLPPGARVNLAIAGVDLLELTLACEYASRIDESMAVA